MSDRELAQRCRPSTLSEVWGNSAVVESLKSMLSNPQRPQTYLFKGNAGCGKTTLARAYANDLGVDEMDLHEINASSTNGIDDMRHLMDELQYRGWGEKRAVILDECHYLSKQAQSSILKLTEEPPEGCYILLCTTDPQLLSKALVSRCIQVEVSPLDEDDMVKHLRRLCKSEGVDTTVDVLEAIADKSEGVPRVALKLLDKVDGMDEESALALLSKEGGVSETTDPDIKELCRLLLAGSPWKALADILKKIKGGDAEGTRRQILGYMAAVLVNSGNPKAACIIGYFTDSFIYSGYAGLTYATYCALAESKNI